MKKLSPIRAADPIPVSDVYALAERDELRQLFIRTDQPQRGAALMTPYSRSAPPYFERLFTLLTRCPPTTLVELHQQQHRIRELRKEFAR
jgi:hypothetical protein